MRRPLLWLMLIPPALAGCAAAPGAVAERSAPPSRVVALAAAATGTAQAPTATPIRLPTPTAGPTGTPTASPPDAASPEPRANAPEPSVTVVADVSASASPRLATPAVGRPNTGPASRATAVPAMQPTPTPESAAPAPVPTETPADRSAPLPPGPQNGPALVPTREPNPEAAVPLDERNRPLVERATRMLADELGIGVEQVTLVLIEAVTWPDGGLGCSEPGAVVQPIETPGYRILLAAGGAQYEFHTDLERQVMLCHGAQVPQS